MNALLLTQYMHLEMVEMPVPAIGPDDVLVRVRACGICGSDVHGLDGSTGRRIPPLVMGHEAAGEVVEAGAQCHRSEGGRPRDVRFHGLLRALLLLPARRAEPLRQPRGAGRFARAVPPPRRVRGVCVGAAADHVPAARQPELRAGGDDRGGVGGGARGQPDADTLGDTAVVVGAG